MDNTLTFYNVDGFMAAVVMLTRENIAFTGKQIAADYFVITITGY